MFFKGYVRTKGKKSIESIKNRDEFKTYEEIKSFGEFAGVLKEDTILVDIDDEKESDILFKIVKDKNLKCRVYKTTRGKHFYFKNSKIKNNKTKTKLLNGLTADIKIGLKNSYGILKYEGKEREILWDTNEPENVPCYLFPTEHEIKFVGLDDGDGRNDALFTYIPKLKNDNFSTNEIRETFEIINYYCFKTPLSQKELETILRDIELQKPKFYEGRKFKHDVFANYLTSNASIKRINGQLHIYKDGVYNYDYRFIEREMVNVIRDLTDAKRKEVLKYLEITCDDYNLSDSNFIAFKNGIYDIDKDELIPFSSEYIITNLIPWNFNSNAYSEIADSVLSSLACHDEEIRMLLEELIGYCFFRQNELGKAFILTGSGSNGKSTFLNMVKNVLGEKNFSTLDLCELDDRFSTIMLFGKLANIGDDISGGFIKDSAIFKKIVTGEKINAEQKGQPKFDFTPYVKLIFSANSVPRIGNGEDSMALLRRLIIVPFNGNFTQKNMGNDFKPYIGNELKSQEVMEYLIKLGIEGLKRVIKNKKFTDSTKANKELSEYEEINNPLVGFFRGIPKEEIVNEITTDVYKRYQIYCYDNGLEPTSNVDFSRKAVKYYGVEVINKKSKGVKNRYFI